MHGMVNGPTGVENAEQVRFWHNIPLARFAHARAKFLTAREIFECAFVPDRHGFVLVL